MCCSTSIIGHLADVMEDARRYRQRLHSSAVRRGVAGRLERRRGPARRHPQALETARTELLQWRHFDHLIVNDDLDEAYKLLNGILADARYRRARNARLGAQAESISGNLMRCCSPALKRGGCSTKPSGGIVPVGLQATGRPQPADLWGRPASEL